jgi:hypothetical protein
MRGKLASHVAMPLTTFQDKSCRGSLLSRTAPYRQQGTTRRTKRTGGWRRRSLLTPERCLLGIHLAGEDAMGQGRLLERRRRRLRIAVAGWALTLLISHLNNHTRRAARAPAARVSPSEARKKFDLRLRVASFLPSDPFGPVSSESRATFAWAAVPAALSL